MIEMTIGSRFYYKGKLCEVSEFNTPRGNSCSKCVFNNTKKCGKAKCCYEHRHDKQEVIFLEVEND